MLGDLPPQDPLTKEEGAITELPVMPLTRTAFAPYGDVIDTDGAGHYPINGGTCLRFHDLARITVGVAGRPLISIFRAQPVAWPLRIERLERHPLGSQAFYPLERRTYLVVVAAPGDRLDEQVPRVFLAGSRQGVNYHPGVWHHPLLALNAESEFLVIDRDGPGLNCEEVALTTIYQISICQM
ncbi:MAG: ureidoglycolate lyase [Gammaproteobacteria bacterium]|nr:ureidoglycolate lyase [Gammaproteobacteria bacterium]